MKEKNFKKVLKTEVEIPKQVEDKMQEAYRMIGADKTSERKSTKIHRRWLTVAAAVALLVCIPAGVYATGGVFYKMIEQNESLLRYKFKVNYEMTPYDIDVVPGYVPKGYEMKESGPYAGKIHNDTNDGGITIMAHNAADIDRAKTMDFSGVTDVKKTKIKNMEAHVITMNWGARGELVRDIILFNEEEGYVIIVWSDGKELSTEELKKVAENLQITKLDTKVAYQTAEERQKEEEQSERQRKKAEKWMEKGISKENVHAAGEEMQNPSLGKWGFSKSNADIRYTVQSVEVKEKLSKEEFPEENFEKYESVEPWLEKDGTLKPHTRYILDRSGTKKDKTVDFRFVVVKMKARNLKASDKGLDINPEFGLNLTPTLVTYDTKKNGNLVMLENQYVYEQGFELTGLGAGGGSNAIYFDKAENLKGMKREKDFLWRTLPEGEELEYTLVYVADESLLAQSYLQMYNRGNVGDERNCTYVKITK